MVAGDACLQEAAKMISTADMRREETISALRPEPEWQLIDNSDRKADRPLPRRVSGAGRRTKVTEEGTRGRQAMR
ncbi:hypothetical protein IE4872_PD02160 (plasmid) [Rhizobium gallicum]|uniref:Uncharacterized protein n=1 Tax=Rhizobium gallicum TaxID=56730 RepID=A0A1L5NXN2_9HYPH|nr:hypothetical protein IE4872_PD02160 [Rhizobium gallicum]